MLRVRNTRLEVTWGIACGAPVRAAVPGRDGWSTELYSAPHVARKNAQRNGAFGFWSVKK
jgi:hypothetical protein